MNGPIGRKGLVTIGIPTRNRCELALRCVRSALAQTYDDIEVVLSDNASTDGTVRQIDEIGDPRLRILQQHENVGMTGNFNACLDNASGEFFLMLSDDDMLESDAIRQLLEPFQPPSVGLDPGSVGLSWCPCTVVDEKNRTLWHTDGGPAVEPSLSLVTGLFDGTRGPRFCGILLRTADARAVGGYQVRHGAICDVGNWTNVALRYEHVACASKPLARYTMHHVSETSRSAVHDWQRAGENVLADLAEALRTRGDYAAEKRIDASAKNFISSLIVTVIMQNVGKSGWTGFAGREALRAARYLFRPSVAHRLIRNSWKLSRLSRG